MKPWYWASFITTDPDAVRTGLEALAEHDALSFDGSVLTYLPTDCPIAELDGTNVRFYRYRPTQEDATRIDLTIAAQESVAPLIEARGVDGRQPHSFGHL